MRKEVPKKSQLSWFFYSVVDTGFLHICCLCLQHFRESDRAWARIYLIGSWEVQSFHRTRGRTGIRLATEPVTSAHMATAITVASDSGKLYHTNWRTTTNSSHRLRVCCVCLVSGAVERGCEAVVSASCNCLQECVCVITVANRRGLEAKIRQASLINSNITCVPLRAAHRREGEAMPDVCSTLRWWIFPIFIAEVCCHFSC